MKKITYDDLKNDPELAEIILMTYITKRLINITEELKNIVGTAPAEEAGGGVEQKII